MQQDFFAGMWSTRVSAKMLFPCHPLPHRFPEIIHPLLTFPVAHHQHAAYRILHPSIIAVPELPVHPVPADIKAFHGIHALLPLKLPFDQFIKSYRRCGRSSFNKLDSSYCIGVIQDT